MRASGSPALFALSMAYLASWDKLEYCRGLVNPLRASSRIHQQQGVLTCTDCPDGRIMLTAALSLSRLRMVRSAKLALTRPSAKALKRARPGRSSSAMTSLESQGVTLTVCGHTAAHRWLSCHMGIFCPKGGASTRHWLDSSITYLRILKVYQSSPCRSGTE